MPEPFHETRYSIFERNFRREPEVTAGTRDVGISLTHVAWWAILEFEKSFAVCGALDMPDQVQYTFGMRIAQIVDPVRCLVRFVANGVSTMRKDRGDDVIDIGEVAQQLPAAEHWNGAIMQDRVGERPIGHVRPPQGP